VGTTAGTPPSVILNANVKAKPVARGMLQKQKLQEKKKHEKKNESNDCVSFMHSMREIALF
jgi:hypothetical protein